MPALRNTRQEAFCNLIVYQNLEPLEAYSIAYQRNRDDSEERCRSSRSASRLLKQVAIRNRLDEMRSSFNSKSIAKQLESLAPDAVNRIKTLIESAESESVQLEASKEVLEHVVPKKSVSVVTRIDLTGEEVAKLEAFLLRPKIAPVKAELLPQDAIDNKGE